MELVKHHGAHARELWVRLQLPQQHACSSAVGVVGCVGLLVPEARVGVEGRPGKKPDLVPSIKAAGSGSSSGQGAGG